MEEKIEKENTEEVENNQTGKESKERKIVIPGEIIFKGEEYLPGEWTEKKKDEIISTRYGIAEESNFLVKVIPLSGPYHPRRGNVVIGKIETLTMNGWVIDIDTPENAFLPLSEVPQYVHKGELGDVLDWDEMVVAKISNINKRGIDLSIKGRGLGKIDEGIIVKINSNKVPRIIGREGSMINVIKDETGCNITVGQNGLIWIKGENIEKEMNAKKTIMHISENVSLHGLTEEVKNFIIKLKQNSE